MNFPPKGLVTQTDCLKIQTVQHSNDHDFWTVIKDIANLTFWIWVFLYTGGILQRLDTDVHSVMTAKTSTALWQRKRAQRCDSDGADSNYTALTVTALGHQWLWHRCISDSDGNWHCCDSGDNRQCCVSGGSWHHCDSDVYISVTAMTAGSAVTAVKTDSAVTAVAADSAVTVMCTLVWQHCQLPLLSQWCAHRCQTNVHIAVTLIRTSLSQRCQCHRCQLSPLSH